MVGYKMAKQKRTLNSDYYYYSRGLYRCLCLSDFLFPDHTLEVWFPHVFVSFSKKLHTSRQHEHATLYRAHDIPQNLRNFKDLGLPENA